MNHGSTNPDKLSAGEKHIHGRHFINDKRALATYLQEIGKVRVLTAKEEKALAPRIRQGDRGALQAMVQANLKFVVAVCRNYLNQGLPFEDLINEGNLGLIRAAKRFEETRNFRFVSYAVWWIRQAILTALADQSRILNVPLARVADLQKMRNVSGRLWQKLGRAPTSLEISEATGIGIREICENLDLSAIPVYLNSDSKDGEETRLEEKLGDSLAEFPDTQVMISSTNARVKALMDDLAEREAEVLRLYFGIGMETTYSLEQIGWRLGLTRERVRQIKEKALRRLRHPSRLKFWKRLIHNCQQWIFIPAGTFKVAPIGSSCPLLSLGGMELPSCARNPEKLS